MTLGVRARIGLGRRSLSQDQEGGSWQQEPTLATNHADLPARMLWLVEAALVRGLPVGFDRERLNQQ